MEALRNVPPTTWLIIGGAGLLASGTVLLWRRYRLYRARKALHATITAAAFDHLVDVLVPDGMGGSFHVDFLLLTPRGILVIDLRDVRGNVFGGDQMSEWTVMDGPHRSTFANPQSGLYDRIAAVKALAGEMPVEGRIVFTRRARFPKGLPTWTLTIDSLRSEFPAVDRSALSTVVGRFEAEWAHVKASVSPSTLSQVRPVAVP
ncbi:MAG: nuclease-related domain-containing protein [Pseudomonadota bacterium]|jgi:Nuclease-related domain.